MAATNATKLIPAHATMHVSAATGAEAQLQLSATVVGWAMETAQTQKQQQQQQ